MQNSHRLLLDDEESVVAIFTFCFICHSRFQKPSFSLIRSLCLNLSSSRRRCRRLSHYLAVVAVLRLVSKGCKLVGCGSAVPPLQISNDDLSKIVDTSDEWIFVRTGIRRRRVLSGGDNLTTLAAEAARKALEMAKVDPDDLDLILMCTLTPEDLFGSAPQIQKQLGCSIFFFHTLNFN